MELVLYTLRTVAYAIVEPMHIFILVVLGVVFYSKNKRISLMQKMTVGEIINSPLELTLSQISLGIVAGAVVSLILSMLGIVFNENSGIEIMFMISVLLLFLKKRFICFSYSGAVLGAISILLGVLSSSTNTSLYINVNILVLMTFVGVVHIAEGFLVIFDGGRGAIPVFSNREEKIVGGFAYNRYWALPVAIFIALSSNSSNMATSSLSMPNWWPLINKVEIFKLLSSSIISAIPLYGVLSYNSFSFTKEKAKKPIYSGMGILIYGIILVLVAQLAEFGIIGQIVVVLFAPLGHELMLKIQSIIEKKGQYVYVTDENGVAVLEVAPNAPAYEGGIRRGDKIIEVNNIRVLSEIDILKIIKENYKEIPIKVKRISGEIVELKVLPKNKRIGMLLVPKFVKSEDVFDVKNNDFKKVLEEMKRKN